MEIVGINQLIILGHWGHNSEMCALGLMLRRPVWMISFCDILLLTLVSYYFTRLLNVLRMFDVCDTWP